MEWNRITQTTAPAATPISLSELKQHLNITHDDEDAYLANLIGSATASIDGPQGIGLAMITQTYRASADSLPLFFTIPLCPVQAVTSIAYTDSNGDNQTVSDFRLDGDSRPAIVYLNEAISDAKAGSIKVTFEAGFGDNASDVPLDLRQALLMICAQYYDARESLIPYNMTALPVGIEAIIRRYAVPA